MKNLIILSLLLVGTPSIANEVITVKTSDMKTFTVQKDNFQCRTTNSGKESSVWCSAYGVMSDLVGNRYQHNVKNRLCAVSFNGETWSYDSVEAFGQSELSCAILRKYNGIQYDGTPKFKGTFYSNSPRY